MNTLSSGYRVFCGRWWRHWLAPSTYYYWLKHKVQRAQRGWADCDTWSLDSYLATWLPAAIRHLKEHSHGFPAHMFEDGDSTEENNYCASDDAYARAEEKWNSILQTIIDGFVAYNRVSDGLYEDELGPYPLHPNCIDDPGMPQTEEQKLRHTCARDLEARDIQKFKEGMALFVEHFQSLWD